VAPGRLLTENEGQVAVANAGRPVHRRPHHADPVNIKP